MIWFDEHLHFNYLKVQSNPIDSESWKSIWKPTLKFEHLADKSKKPITMTEHRLVSRKTSGSLYNDVDVIFQNESYKGRDNPIKLVKGRLKNVNF